MASIYLKLVKVQNELKAPKSQYNSFGKYNYRNQEDILEAVKPLLLEHGLTLIIKDDIELIGDRYYVKANCILIDTETGETIENSALARESIDKKSMDDSQITGATSSYARKYALNGLFLIDDTRDPDTDEFQKKTRSNNEPKPYPTNNYNNNSNYNSNSSGNNEKPATPNQLKFLNRLIGEYASSKGSSIDTVKAQFANKYNVQSIEELPSSTVSSLIDKLKTATE